MPGFEFLKIDLRSLPGGNTEREFRLGDDFFGAQAPGGAEVRRGDVAVKLAIQRVGERLFTLSFSIAGEVKVACDRCLDEMSLAISAQRSLAAELGEGETDDETLRVSESDGTIDLAWPIYEAVALSVPLSHAHASRSECNGEMIRLLDEHAASLPEDDEPADARWNELTKLRTILNE